MPVHSRLPDAPPTQWPIYVGTAVTIASLIALFTIPIHSEWKTSSLRREVEARVEPAREAVDEFELALARESSSIRGYLLTGDDSIRERYFYRQRETDLVLERLDTLAAPMGGGFARHLAAMKEELNAWRIPYGGVVGGNMSRSGASAILREHQDHYEAAVQTAKALTSTADSMENVYRAAIRQAERTGNMLTAALALLTLVSVGVVLWFAWRIRRLAESLRRTAKDEEALRLIAEAAVRSRDEVLAIVSHDLRNPLSSISLGAHLLASDTSPAVRSSQAESIQRSVARMNRLINDLLDVARLEAGNTISIEPLEMDVAFMLHDLVDEFRQRATEQGVRLDCNVEGEIPPILADRDRVFQALANLVGNAIKFTPSGGKVTIHATNTDGAVAFSVSDTGLGIPEEDTERVFSPYWQAGGTARLGTGLGLPIARGIAEAHGGHVRLQSIPGEGATFTFELPVGRVALSPA